MKTIEIMRLESPNREPLIIEGFLFGDENASPSVAIVGAMTGDSVNQLFVASSLVDELRQKEEKGLILGKILIIPSVNHYSLNMGQTYWPLDKTDINMMFPGFTQGETTQRIAAQLFSTLQGYDIGIILERRRDKAFCMPYIKLIQSGYEDIEIAKEFGLRFIHHRPYHPVETVMLQYNWQLWGTQSFSIVFGDHGNIDHPTTQEVKLAIKRVLSKQKIINEPIHEGYTSNIISPEHIVVIKAQHAGIFDPVALWGSSVKEGETLARITNALTGEKLEKIVSPVDGIVTCFYNYSLIFENSIAFRIAKA
jgi:predicted deacylase